MYCDMPSLERKVLDKLKNTKNTMYVYDVYFLFRKINILNKNTNCH